jgi:hypothetical protein
MIACAVFALGLASANVEAADAKAKTAKPAAKAKAKPKSKAKGKPAPEAESTLPAKRRHLGVSAAYIVGDTDAHFINDQAPQIQPFGEQSHVVKKAFAENRRVQIGDAEKAARAEKSPDRWRTVLFMLHDLPERGDSEVCFWRVLSFYRLGELERARKVRENCELPAKDSSTLNQEDARAAGTPSIEDVQRAALAQGQTPRDAGADGPSPTSAYTGPSPQRRD